MVEQFQEWSSLAIYIACRIIGAPRTLKEIAAISNTKRKNIALCCRLLIGELDLKVPIADPMKRIVKIANKAESVGENNTTSNEHDDRNN